MKELILPVLEAFRNKENVLLIFVAASAGSAPRKTGSVMAVFQNGVSHGTVGGGALEFEAQKKAHAMLADNNAPPSVTVEYDLADEEVSVLHMICGGDVLLHFEKLRPEDYLIKLFEEAEKSTDGDLWFVMKIKQGEQAEFSLSYDRKAAPEALRPLLRRTAANDIEDSGYFVIPLEQSGFVYIFGGGHVGAQLVPILTRVGFSCVVYDNRPDFAKPERHPGASRVILGEYDEILKNVSFTREDYIVIVTSGHKYDFTVLTQTLPSGARYIGCIGSRRKMAITRRRLINDAGLPPETVARLVNPIGIAIGAETPEEIAVSVAAELIKLRADTSAAETGIIRYAEELEEFAAVINSRAMDLHNNPSLATARARAVLTNLLTEGVRGFLDRGVPAEAVRSAIQRAAGEAE